MHRAYKVGWATVHVRGNICQGFNALLRSWTKNVKYFYILTVNKVKNKDQILELLHCGEPRGRAIHIVEFSYLLSIYLRSELKNIEIHWL